ncbi:MAG TPA: winged helix-turn-helix domain-containing protein [Verrucomicrobiae bacterium]|nr:winged helix-turn-helix domain-containing protein [Verrucomicrobiae bacterium]
MIWPVDVEWPPLIFEVFLVPSEPSNASGRVRFGQDFELDLRVGELRRSGRLLKLEHIPTEMLRLLIEQKEQLVSRDQIIERIWGKDVFLDTDNSINAAIRKIRQVLKDDPAKPRFVQTITGRGYRFIAQVVDVKVPSVKDDIPQPAVAGEDFSDSRLSWLWLRRWPVLLGISIVLLPLSAYFQWPGFRPRYQPSSARLMLAVLPFANLTGDAGQDYFSDGLTEEMIAQLGHLDSAHLGVIARTSVMHYKHSQEPLEQVGRELGVQYVLEGSVRRDSDRVRITVQLVQMKDQTRLWSRQYDRDLGHLLALQREIAQEIANEIQLALDDQRRNDPAHLASRAPASYEAYESYLKGRYSLNKRTPGSLQQAIEYFQQAVAKDPGYARGYAGLADSYALVSGYDLSPRTESMPKARAAALRALEIDDQLAEAHNSLALIAENYDWDWQTAEKEFRWAIRLDPNYATAHHWYAEYLAYQGRFDEAFAESERARQLDPLSLIIAADNGAILYYSRQYDRAIEKLRAVQEMEPNFPRAHLLSSVYLQKGMYAEALADIERWRRFDNGPWIPGYLAYVYGHSGQRLRAQQELRKLEQLSRHRPLDPGPILMAHIGMGNKNEAFAWLEKAYLSHSTMLTSLKVDPFYDPLRSDPRFQELMRRVRLAQ